MRRNNSLSHMLLGAALTLGASQAMALKELDDSSLSEVQGAGLAFAMDDFSMEFAPTSFIELTGTGAQGTGWERGDARYYGLSMTSGAASGTDWFGNGCTGDALACPLGNGGVTGFASPYDPYLLRVFQYPGHDYTGAYLSSPGNMPTVMELIGPSSTDPWRWSFWGELEVDRFNENVDPTVDGGHLQSQTIIHGKPVTTDGKPAILRLMRTTGMGATEDTFGITYQSALSGDFRFSVRQNGGSPDALHWVPDFNDTEGMYFKNVDAYLPLGTLHYQAITFDSTGDGNFIIELTQIPNIANIYNHFYCGSGTSQAPANCALNADGSIQSPNNDTRGYVRWGDFTGVDITTGAGLPGATDTTNGIYFVGGDDGVGNPSSIPTNIGISRIEGMRIHHLKITTLGAGI